MKALWMGLPILAILWIGCTATQHAGRGKVRYYGNSFQADVSLQTAYDLLVESLHSNNCQVGSFNNIMKQLDAETQPIPIHIANVETMPSPQDDALVEASETSEGISGNYDSESVDYSFRFQFTFSQVSDTLTTITANPIALVNGQEAGRTKFAFLSRGSSNRFDIVIPQATDILYRIYYDLDRFIEREQAKARPRPEVVF